MYTHAIALIFKRVFFRIFLYAVKMMKKSEIYVMLPQQTKEIKLHAKLITLIAVFKETSQKKNATPTLSCHTSDNRHFILSYPIAMSFMGILQLF